MTGLGVFVAAYVALCVLVTRALSRAMRPRPTPPFPPEPVLWVVPDTVADLEAELPQGGAR